MVFVCDTMPERPDFDNQIEAIIARTVRSLVLAMVIILGLKLT